MNGMQLFEKIKVINPLDINSNKLREYFAHLTPQEIEVALDFLKNLDFYKLKIENFDLSNEEAAKNLLLTLALRNEIKKNFEELKKLEVEFLKTVDSLDGEIKNKIIMAYLSNGVHLVRIDKNIEEFKYKKIVLKHFHDLGGFEAGIWGIKINYELFLALIKEIDFSLIEKLERKTNVLTKDSFVMLANLF